MRSALVYRVSGNSLMYAALLWAIGIVLMPRFPARTWAQVTAAVGPAWVAVGLLLVAGCVLGIVAMVGLYRHFAGGEQEGWALIGVTCGVLGMIVTAIAAVLSGIGQPVLVRFACAAPQPSSLESAHVALKSAALALWVVGGALNWLALLPFSLAMLSDRAWSRAIAWSTMTCAVVETLAPPLLLGQPAIVRLVMLLGFAYLVVLGSVMARMGRVATPAAAQPEVGAGI